MIPVLKSSIITVLVVYFVWIALCKRDSELKMIEMQIIKVEYLSMLLFNTVLD